MNFDFQPRLNGAALSMRPLAEADFEGLYLAASAPETWAVPAITPASWAAANASRG